MEYCENNSLHRIDKPASIGEDGLEQYYKNGQRHREDGPANICLYGPGCIIYYKHGKLDREGDLPTIIELDGSLFYHVEHQLHRETGPAVIYSDGTKEYYIKGKIVAEKEVLDLLSQK